MARRRISQILNQAMMALVLLTTTLAHVEAAQTDWRAVAFQDFVQKHADTKRTELAKTYQASGVKLFSFMLGQELYTPGWKNPVERDLKEFKQWCVAHDGVVALSVGRSRSDDTAWPAIKALSDDLRAQFKSARGTVRDWFECRGPEKATALVFLVNGPQAQRGDQQKSALFFYSGDQWTELLDTYRKKQPAQTSRSAPPVTDTPRTESGSRKSIPSTVQQGVGSSPIAGREMSNLDAQGRQIVRGPVFGGNHDSVHIVSNSVGVIAGPGTSITNSVIEAPVCVQSDGNRLHLNSNHLQCDLCVEFTTRVLLNVVLAHNTCSGRGTNRPDVFN